MHDLDALLAEIDPMPSSIEQTAAPNVAAAIYERVLERRGAELTGASPGPHRRHVSPSRLNRSRWSSRRAMVVGLVVAISIGLVVVPLAVVNTTRHGLVPGDHLTTTQTHPTTTLPPPVSQGPWPTSVLTHANIAPRSTLFVPAGSLSSTSPAEVFGFENDDCMEPCAEPLVRLDPHTGSLFVGPVVAADSALAMAGHHLVLLTPHEVMPDAAIVGGWSLRFVNSASLQLGPVLRLPFLGDRHWVRTSGDVAGTKDIWITSGYRLWLVSTSDAAIVRSVPVTGFVQSIVESPNSQSLFALGTATGGSGNRAVVTELDARTGRVLARTSQADPGGSAQMTAVSTGVWVTTNGSARLLSANGLRAVTLPRGALPPDPAAAGVYRGYTVYALGSVLLAESYRGMTCLAPDTGTLRATALFAANKAPAWTPVAVTGGGVLAVEGRGITTAASIILNVRVPSVCSR